MIRVYTLNKYFKEFDMVRSRRSNSSSSRPPDPAQFHLPWPFPQNIEFINVCYKNVSKANIDWLVASSPDSVFGFDSAQDGCKLVHFQIASSTRVLLISITKKPNYSCSPYLKTFLENGGSVFYDEDLINSFLLLRKTIGVCLRGGMILDVTGNVPYLLNFFKIHAKQKLAKILNRVGLDYNKLTKFSKDCSKYQKVSKL
jgi:hypothetical protein